MSKLFLLIIIQQLVHVLKRLAIECTLLYTHYWVCYGIESIMCTMILDTMAIHSNSALYKGIGGDFLWSQNIQNIQFFLILKVFFFFGYANVKGM